MADYMELAAALRAQRAQQEAQRRQQFTMGGQATGGGSQPIGSTLGGMPPVQQQQQQSTASPGSQIMDGASTYLKVKGMAPTASAGAQLGGSMTGGGSQLGSMLGSYGGSSAAPASFGTLGSTTSGGLGAMLGGGNAATAGASTGYAGAGAGGAAGGLLGALGPAAAFLGGAKILNDSGTSSYGSTFSGKAPEKMIDQYLPGIADSAVGNFGKSMGGLFMGDVGGFAKNGLKAAKDFFTLDWI